MIIFAILVFLIGLCIGSFLNVVILRGLSGESIVMPPSKCPACDHKLYWWHNIPIISYILLRGKCGFCKAPISIQYPLVEGFTGLIFVLVFLKYGISLDTLFAWIISSLFIVLSVTDLKEKVVLDFHTYLLIATGLIYSLCVMGFTLYQDYAVTHHFSITTQWLVNNNLTVALAGAILGFVVMEVVSRIGYLIAGDRAFGEGDSYIAAGLGAIFGWRLLLVVLVLSVVIQVLATLPLFVKNEIKKKNWTTVIALSVFIFYTLGFLIAQYCGWLNNTIAYLISTLVLIIMGILTCREILRGIRQPENRTYLPFGPALILSGFFVLLI